MSTSKIEPANSDPKHRADDGSGDQRQPRDQEDTLAGGWPVNERAQLQIPEALGETDQVQHEHKREQQPIDRRHLPSDIHLHAHQQEGYAHVEQVHRLHLFHHACANPGDGGGVRWWEAVGRRQKKAEPTVMSGAHNNTDRCDCSDTAGELHGF